jgi:hypothetical protein
MAVDLVYETHSISVDNERGVATGWLPGELSVAGRQLAAALASLERLVTTGMTWQEGWRYRLDASGLRSPGS